MTEEKETARLEAFSDGVFAVAITLLGLDIHVPKFDALPPGGLGAALLSQWPMLLVYVTSFLSILVMWLNHNRLFEHNHPQRSRPAGAERPAADGDHAVPVPNGPAG